MGALIEWGRRGWARRLGAVITTGTLVLAAAGPVQAVAPTVRPPVLPARTGVQQDTAKMVGYDVGGGTVGFGAVRLTTWYNAERFTKQTLKFAMHDLGASARYYAKIFQGSCDDETHHYRISTAVRANSSGRLTSTVTLTAAQRALMLQFNGEYPAVSIELVPFEPWTGVSYPCGQLWGEGLAD